MTFHILLGLFISLPAHSAKSCLPVPFKGFTFTETQSGVENFISVKKEATLSAKCFGKGFKIADVKDKLGREVQFQSLREKIEYFDLNREGTLTRTFLVESPAGLYQLTFFANPSQAPLILKLNQRVLEWWKDFP